MGVKLQRFPTLAGDSIVNYKLQNQADSLLHMHDALTTDAYPTTTATKGNSREQD